MRARHATPCANCKQRINEGDDIHDTDSGLVHDQCPQPEQKYAHELYPEPDGHDLATDVPYLFARALGFRAGTDQWHEYLSSGDEAKQRMAWERTVLQCELRGTALVADALAQGMSGQEAWTWSQERADEESGEWIWERATAYGVDPEAIKPYPIEIERPAS